MDNIKNKTCSNTQVVFMKEQFLGCFCKKKEY